MTKPSDDLGRLLAETSFVRALARSLLADESDEVEQQTWLRALRAPAAPVRYPRRWLAAIARNVAHNLRRARGRRQAAEAAAPRRPEVPSTAELLQRQESRRALVLAVDALPAELREVVLLRFFEDLRPRAIARGLGTTPGTVSNRLRRALHLLRTRLDERAGGRAALLLPLLDSHPSDLATVGSGTQWLHLGGTLMTTKAKGLLAAAAMLGFAASWWCWREAVIAPPPVAITPRPTAAAPAATGLPAPALLRVPDAPAPAGGTVPTVASTTGELVVHASYGPEGTPAAGLVVAVTAAGWDARLQARHVRTDAKGMARLTDLPAGRIEAWAAGNAAAHADQDVPAGGSATCELVLPPGIDVDGEVVDEAGLPIAGAEVLLAPLDTTGRDAEVVAHTGDDGRFALHACNRASLVGARASGRLPSPLQLLYGKVGRRFPVRIVLAAGGGEVAGEVVDGGGCPVAGALVRIGRGRLDALDASEAGAPPPPVQVATEADGTFRAIGVAPGSQPVQVRAAALAPWTGTVTVPPSDRCHLHVVLGAGAGLCGRVFTADRAPAAGCELRIGGGGELASARAVADADGVFAFRGLPAGEALLIARQPGLGTAEVPVVLVSGEVVTQNVELAAGIVLTGRVRAGGTPVAGMRITAMPAGSPPEPGSWSSSTLTDTAGAFAMAGCPDGLLRVLAVARGYEPIVCDAVDPRAGELLLEASAAAIKTASVHGIVVGPDATPVPGAIVFATRPDGREHPAQTEADGRFDIGPIAPGPIELVVESSTFAPLRAASRVLIDGDRWDAGVLTLAPGGRVRFELGDADREGIQLRLWGADGRPLRVPAEGEPLLSPVLAPGRYRAQLEGDRVAAAGADVTVTAGDETTITLPVRRGIAVQLEFAGGNWSAVAHIQVRVSAGDTLVLQTRAGTRRGPVPQLCCRLLPGCYRVEATAGGWSAAASFTVASQAEALVVRVGAR